LADRPLWDLAEDKDSIALIESFVAAGKPVAFVCLAPGVLQHGVLGLRDFKNKKNGG
jgi:enhancing lycopene biosynthesis protein 2